MEPSSRGSGLWGTERKQQKANATLTLPSLDDVRICSAGRKEKGDELSVTQKSQHQSNLLIKSLILLSSLTAGVMHCFEGTIG